jgi:hypothetical protein
VFPAPFEENLGAFLPALHGLRLIVQTTAAETASGCRRVLFRLLIVQTTAAETASGCPKPPPNGFLRRAAAAWRAR